MTITPGLGTNAQEWVNELQVMYDKADSFDEEHETGIHAKTFLNAEGLRETVFAIVNGVNDVRVRRYVLYPYKMVKDMKTGKETDRIEDVLNGNLKLVSERE